MKYGGKLIRCTMIGIFVLIGCNTDELQTFSINAQVVNQIDVNFFFTSVELGAASFGENRGSRYVDGSTNIGMCSYAIQQLADAGGGFSPGDKYQYIISSFDPNNAFHFIYGGGYPGVDTHGGLTKLAEIIKQTGPGGYDEGKKVNLRNAARILKAFLFARLTDYYGSIPYFEALQATTSSPIFFPKYDKQKDVYIDLLKELDEASAALNTSFPDEGFSQADIIYNGDIVKWKRWGYSLMLRAAMKVSNVDAALANTYITKAVNGGVFTSNADNVWVPMAIGPDAFTNQNGISRIFNPSAGGLGLPSFLSKTLVDWLKGTNPGSIADDDPRLMILSGGIARWTSSGWTLLNGNPLEQKGMPNGHDQSSLNALEGTNVNQEQTYSRINYLMLQLNEPYMLMNYGEVKLLLAEASARGLGGLTPAAAASHYNAGVKASMQMYTPYDASFTVSDDAVMTYLTTYPYGIAKPELEMIGEQLWVNHFFNWWEAWSDWRRTGFPKLTPTNYPGNVTGGTIPQRLNYPSAEVGVNPNFEAGSTKPNLWTTKLWFAGGVE